MAQKTESKPNWRRRILIGALALFALYLCFGVWGVPRILVAQIQKHGSEALGREVVVDRATFNPFTLEAKLYETTVGPAEGESGKLVTLGKVAVNPQVSSAFGTITLKSVILENGEAWVSKDEQGVFNFQDILDRLAATPAEPETEGEPISAVLRDLAISNFRVNFTDASLDDTYEETVIIETVNGRDIGTVERASSEDSGTDGYHWDFDSKILTESGAELVLVGGAKSITPWIFEVKTSLDKFALASVQPFVSESVVADLSGALGFQIDSIIEMTDTDPKITASGTVSLGNFLLRDAEQEFAAFESFTIDGIEFDLNAMDLNVGSIAMLSPNLSAILLEDQSLRLPEFKTSQDSGPSAEGTTEPSSDFTANVASFTISQGKIDLLDRSSESPFQTSLENFELKISDLNAKQSGGDLDVAALLELSLSMLGGGLRLNGELESLEGLATADLELSGLQLAQLQSYVSRYANATVEKGSLSLAIHAEAESLANPRVSGSVDLAALNIQESLNNNDVFSLESLSLGGIDFAGESLTINEVKLVDPAFRYAQSAESDNLSRIIKLEQDVEKAVEGAEQKSGVKIVINRLELLSAGIEFVDTSLVSNMQGHLNDFDLFVDSISTDPDKVANFEFEGRVEGGAVLKGTGQVNLADPKVLMDLDLAFSGFDLVETNPYWQTYLGRSLAKGRFEISSNYQIRDSQLKGTNGFRIEELTLGEKVESDRAINLPLGFAMKLLKDPSGTIAYPNLRVEGDLSEPQVKPWGLIGKAFRNLILNAAASPFKFLAGMVGGREDLDTIAFEVGEVALDQEALDKVDALRKIMQQRPGLGLEVSFNPSAEEREYLEKQYALHFLANPNFEVASGLDLLAPIDNAALRSSVENQYAATLEAQNPTGDEQETTTEVSGLPETKEKAGNEVKLLKRIKTALGLAKKDKTGEVDEDQAEVAEAPAASSATEEAGTPEVGFEEKLALVLEKQSLGDFQEGWLTDLSEERVSNFEQELVKDGAVDASRITTAAGDAAEGGKAAGNLVLSLSE